ncbi:MAG TPA: Gfo/Idh/MocA family oxidoreductase, partial [Devosiaceae bacterium]|nr:Gfo/Idh/MocA family oxidoreductase [Devosiaceae bacterium]
MTESKNSSAPGGASEIGVGVVGAGHWGRNLVRTFTRLGALRAVCDPDQAALAPARDGNIPTYANIESLLEDPAVTAVALATPAATHAALAAQALATGKHVFVEKPLCLAPTEGPPLRDTAARAGLTLMVGHLLLYHPAYRSLKRLVEAGDLGELRYIYSNRLSLGRIRREENALWSFAPHDVSMILDLAGRLPETVSTSGGTYLSPTVADTTLSSLAFSDRLRAHIFVSWLHPYKDHRTVVIGTEAMAVFHDSLSGPEKLLLYRHKVAWDGEIPDIERAEAEPVAYGDDEPLMLECRHFLDCVATGARPRSNADEAIAVLSVLDACQQSLTTGGPVSVRVPAAA